MLSYLIKLPLVNKVLTHSLTGTYKGYKGVPGLTTGYSWLPGITGGYKGLHGATRGYRG